MEVNYVYLSHYERFRVACTPRNPSVIFEDTRSTDEIRELTMKNMYERYRDEKIKNECKWIVINKLNYSVYGPFSTYKQSQSFIDDDEESDKNIFVISKL